ncbi:MAG TPA: hypothetical protein VFI47_04000 [Acidimicrobiales bacterium]|nr:hypothetical protein [Acidimicrobiales bacterium]
MKRLFLLASASALVFLGFGAAPAGAGTPASPGCYGESISALATADQPFPGAFGQAVVGFAQAPPDESFPLPGLGDGVQALQDGQVPDNVVPNTCN